MTMAREFWTMKDRMAAVWCIVSVPWPMTTPWTPFSISRPMPWPWRYIAPAHVFAEDPRASPSPGCRCRQSAPIRTARRRERRNDGAGAVVEPAGIVPPVRAV